MGTRKRRKKKIKIRKKKIKNSRKKKFIRDNCAPKQKNKKLGFTCYTSNSLHKLKKIWNMRHPDALINTNDSREIWDALKYYLKKTCKRESCWLKQKIFKNNLDHELSNLTFAPPPPKEWRKKPLEWITSVEMIDVMRQYEKAYPDFEFLGPSPIDFGSHKAFGECVWEDICQFNLKSFLKRGIKKIGIIFNLDAHYDDGSHWIALFIDIPKGQICYFDSYGDRPPKRVKRFMRKVQKQSKGLGEEFEIIVNSRRHQFSISECGMYCLYFIIQLLKGEDFKEMKRSHIKDKVVKDLRISYFNDNLKK